MRKLNELTNEFMGQHGGRFARILSGGSARPGLSTGGRFCDSARLSGHLDVFADEPSTMKVMTMSTAAFTVRSYPSILSAWPPPHLKRARKTDKTRCA